jgi:hypothetical protein
VTLTATPTTVASGGSATLNWSSVNATACTASGGWTGSKTLTGSEARSGLAATTTFTLTCTGAGGTAAQSVTVTVAAGPTPPTVSRVPAPRPADGPVPSPQPVPSCGQASLRQRPTR